MTPGQQPAIHRLAYETNAFCNEQCGFCFATFATPPEIATDTRVTSSEVDTRSTLTTEELKTNVIKPFREMGGVILHFTGGDPFLRKDLPELIEYAGRTGLLVSIDTNCLIVTSPASTGLYERLIPRLYRVGIPLDARRESLQIALRGHKLAQRAPLRFLEMAEEMASTTDKFPEIKINTLVTSLNHNDVPNLLDVLERYIRPTQNRPTRLVGRWSIDKFLPMERGEASREQYQIEEVIYRQVMLAVRDKLAQRGLPDIVTGDQDKTNTTLLLSPQGMAYVPSADKKYFVGCSVRNTDLASIVTKSTLANRDTQYIATLGGTHGNYTYRHPYWEEELVGRPA